MGDSAKKDEQESLGTPLGEAHITNRKFIRYTPGPLEAAYINFSNHKGDKWETQQIALIEDESSMGGCGLIFQKYKFNKHLEKGSKVTIKLGPLEPLYANCVYVVELNDYLVKAGFKFLE